MRIKCLNAYMPKVPERSPGHGEYSGFACPDYTWPGEMVPGVWHRDVSRASDAFFSY